MKQIFPLKSKNKEIVNNKESFFKVIGKDIILKAKITPNSSGDEFLGVVNGHLKIAISAPAVEGKANKRCINFLAKSFKVAKSKLEITSGLKSKEKVIKIFDLSEEIFLEKVSKIIKGFY